MPFQFNMYQYSSEYYNPFPIFLNIPQYYLSILQMCFAGRTGPSRPDKLSCGSHSGVLSDLLNSESADCGVTSHDSPRIAQISDSDDSDPHCDHAAPQPVSSDTRDTRGAGPCRPIRAGRLRASVGLQFGLELSNQECL